MTKLSRRAFTFMLASGAMLPALATAQGKQHTVVIRDFGFEPANLIIKAGDSVTFTNKDRAPHTATANSGAFDTGRLKRGKSATVKISQKGTLNYFCEVHPRMKATIVVK